LKVHILLSRQTFELVDLPNLIFNLDVYAYICNARPDKNFEENGGELNVVVVQRGHMKFDVNAKTPEVDLYLGISQMRSIIAEPMDQLEANSTEDSHKCNDIFVLTMPFMTMISQT
jgi:hypothetical protein